MCAHMRSNNYSRRVQNHLTIQPGCSQKSEFFLSISCLQKSCKGSVQEVQTGIRKYQLLSHKMGMCNAFVSIKDGKLLRFLGFYKPSQSKSVSHPALYQQALPQSKSALTTVALQDLRHDYNTLKKFIVSLMQGFDAFLVLSFKKINNSINPSHPTPTRLDTLLVFLW